MSETVGSTAFATATHAEPLGSGRYRGTIDAGWFGPPGPNGGIVAALVLRAIRAEVAEDARLPRSLTLHYLRPPREGEVEIEVTVERSGRTATTCSARMTQGGKLTSIALCALTLDFEGAAEWLADPPDAPAAEDVPEVSMLGTPPPIFERLETRGVFGSKPFSGGDEAVVGGWLRTREGDRLTPELLAFFADAWWPAPFSRLEAPVMAPTLELTIHFRAQPDPADDQTLVMFWTQAATDGLFDEQGEVWGADGRLLVQSRQLALFRPWNPT